jgi:hypothetical protein
VAGAKRRQRVPAALREPGFAAKPDVFLRFQLRHPQEMAEHFEPMVLRQPGQIGHGFGDKLRGLIPPAIAGRLTGP